MSEIRNIFSAPNGDEFHCWIHFNRDYELVVDEPIEIEVKAEKVDIRNEGPYRVWTVK